jgi:hypothetical protein
MIMVRRKKTVLIESSARLELVKIRNRLSMKVAQYVDLNNSLKCITYEQLKTLEQDTETERR